jgi:putative oxidoreductase
MMKTFPYMSAAQSQVLLRITVSLFLLAHGVARTYLGTIGGFGEFLNSRGFVIGGVLAWAITIFEIVGGTAMALNYFVKWIAAVFIIELATGIVLVHAPQGWFVVGATLGGMEYSVLLIVCLLVIASHHKK